ncbi:SIR2 family NAD-dependent protein deacylase [Algoriphagus vanfongensis]|uniref:SIR2 family NAD-dependent protein deacylase n=1 Tax=Algoriphagus vanfongensis TaxID=426371 RepID=UPI00041B474B|nr:SIR2 family protein [Algoriphagus vanfongensis]
MKFKGTIPPEIIQAIKSNRCILFVGSGLSAKVARTNGKKLPLWGAFLNELLDYAKSKNAIFWNGPEEIEDTIKKGNYLLAAQELQECISLGEFSEFLNSIFRDRKVIPTTTHKNVFKIPFRAILTTNYDSLLEGAYALTHEGQVPVKFTQEDLKTISSPLRNEDFFLFKIHGDIDRPESIVLGSRSYNQILFRTPEYLHFLETLFTTHTVLFVGFSGNDIDMDFVIDRLSTIYSRTLNKHYILLPNNKFNLTEKRRLLLDKRLEVIDYEADSNHSEVDNFFDALNELQTNSSEQDIKPKPRKRNFDFKSDIFIISSKNFHDKYENVITKTLSKFKHIESQMWFIGLDSIKDYEDLNRNIERSDNVVMFFDSEVLKMKEIESLFELITLREIDEKIKIIPIAIVSDPIRLPVFIRRRMIFMEELNEENLTNILKSYKI